MAAKTYVVGLRIILRQFLRYATRYQAQLSVFLSPEAYTCLLATITAANECLALVPVPEPVD